jgi:hypothetical protein
MGLLDIFRRNGKSNEDLTEELRLLNLKHNELLTSSSKQSQDFSKAIDEKLALERKFNELLKSIKSADQNLSDDSSTYSNKLLEAEKKINFLLEELKVLTSQNLELESLINRLGNQHERQSRSRRYLANKYLEKKRILKEFVDRANDLNTLANPFRLLDPKVEMSEREKLIYKNFELLKLREDKFKGIEKNLAEFNERESAIRTKEDALRLAAESQKEIFHENQSLKSQLISLKQKINHLENNLVQRVNSNDEFRLLKIKLDQAEIEIGNLKKGTGDDVWLLKRQIDELKKLLTDKEFQISQSDFKLSQTIKSFEKQLNALELQKSQIEKLAESRFHQLTELRNSNEELVECIEVQKEEISELSSEIVNHIEDSRRNSQPVVSKQSTDKSNARVQDCIAMGGNFSNAYILDWLTEVYEPKDFSIAGGYLATLGSGPWSSDSFMTLLLERGYSLWELPDSEVVHLVVGREGWSEDALLNQIDVCSGVQLRIYSQEMWISLLMTGRDPFDAEDQTLLDEFAKGHPALEFLQGLDVPWPEVSENLDHSVTEIDASDFGVSESPLHILGYKVGVTSELTVAQRRKILKDCIDHKELTFSYDSTDEYIKKWGRPMSPQRLYRIAVHIKSMADGRVGKDPRKPQARLDWIEDLSWLKVNFAKLHAKRFVWPDIS